MSVVYDAGVLGAADRNHRQVWADDRALTAARLDSAIVTSDTRDIRRLADHPPSPVRMQLL